MCFPVLKMQKGPSNLIHLGKKMKQECFSNNHISNNLKSDRQSHQQQGHSNKHVSILLVPCECSNWQKVFLFRSSWQTHKSCSSGKCNIFLYFNRLMVFLFCFPGFACFPSILPETKYYPTTAKSFVKSVERNLKQRDDVIVEICLFWHEMQLDRCSNPRSDHVWFIRLWVNVWGNTFWEIYNVAKWENTLLCQPETD